MPEVIAYIFVFFIRIALYYFSYHSNYLASFPSPRRRA